MLPLVPGVLMILGALLPSAVWIGLLRNDPPPQSADLLAGVALFRLALAVLGAYAVAGARLTWWSRRAGPLEPMAASPYGGGASPASRRELGVVVALMGLGTVLRLHRLDEGLWNDEVLTLVDFARLPVGQVVSTYLSQNQHFLFSVLGSLSVSTFGESAWALRLPAVLFGVLTLWALWKFGRWVAGPREGLLAATLLTFSYEHIWFSQNARGYSLLLFWSLVSSHLFLRACRERNGRLWLGYALTVALGMYTHLTMIFMVAGQGAVYAWHLARHRGDSREAWWTPLAAGFALAGLLTVTMYAFALPQMPNAMAADRSDVALWRSPVWMLSEIARVVGAGPLVSVAAAAGSVIFAAGLVDYWRRSPELPLLFLVPVLSGGATMIALQHHLWPRFFFFAAGFAILFVVRGLFVVVGALGERWRWPTARSTFTATVLTLVAVAALGRSLPYVYGPKQDYAGARDFIESRRAPDDAVVTVGGGATAFRVYYAPEWLTVTTLEELNRIRADSEDTWLVYAMAAEIENSFPSISAAARDDFELMGVFGGTVRGGEIVVFRAKHPDLPGSGPGPGGSGR